MTDRQFAAVIRAQPIDVLLLALEQVTTYSGAMRIVRAEQAGRRRYPVLLTASRRLEQLGGSETPGRRTSVIAVGVSGP